MKITLVLTAQEQKDLEYFVKELNRRDDFAHGRPWTFRKALLLFLDYGFSCGLPDEPSGPIEWPETHEP